MKGQIDGQMDLSIGLRDKCNVKSEYPCTYYNASRLRYLMEGLECSKTCCYGCEEKRLCGYACNACKY